ncbi:hypothetical protein ACHAWF_012459 [Thalassiosira exigua]
MRSILTYKQSNMRSHGSIGGACICLVILGTSSSRPHRLGPAFAYHNNLALRKGPLGANKVLSFTQGGDDDLFEAEEAAAIDAHDLSDPGIEGAAMERAVIMATELKDQPEHEKEPKPTFLGKIRSFFQSKKDGSNEDVLEVEDAEANYARDLSVVSAVEHAKAFTDSQKHESQDGVLKVMNAEANYARELSVAAALEHSLSESQDDKGQGGLLRVMNTEANYARDLSVAAALEHSLSESQEDKSQEDKGQDGLLKVMNAEANYARDLSVAAALEHADASFVEESEGVEDNKERVAGVLHMLDDDRIASIEEHYKSVEKDIEAIEHLIEDADKADKADGYSLERTFSDDDAADLALMMIEKSVIAATDKLELCQKKAEETEYEVKIALEEKYAAKALAESIERDRRAAEMRFLSTEHFGEDPEVMERRRDSSILHADSELLSEALEREHNAELELEKAIEHDIATKRELEQMIDNKAALKQEFHDLEKIVHERTMKLWEKENAKKSESKKNEKHHFDWWHRRW